MDSGPQDSAPIPEAWIGQQVAIIHAQRTVHGELVEVNDRGVALLYSATERPGAGGFGEDVTVRETQFFPWHEIRLISRSA